jgi:tetratricopeptide (TPR) repeat protein
MSFLSFTTLTKRRPRPGGRRATATPSRYQTVVTATLLFLWLVLMVFGGVTYAGPQWLRELSMPGRRSEAAILKSYGDDLYRQGNYAMAAAQYKGALERNPNQFDARLNLALSLDKIGRTEEAISILKEVLQSELGERERGAICHNLGAISARQGKRNEAIAFFEQAVSVSFDLRPLLVKLSSLYLEAGQLEKARATLEKALASRLDVALPYRLMLRAALDDYEDEETHLAGIQERLSRDPGEEQLARYDLQTIRRMQGSDVEIAEIHNKLAYICMRFGERDEATGHMQKVLEIMPDNADARKNLASLQRMKSTENP